MTTMKKTVGVPPIQIRLSDDQKALKVWTTEEKPSLDAEQVRLLILALAGARRGMVREEMGLVVFKSVRCA